MNYTEHNHCTINHTCFFLASWEASRKLGNSVKFHMCHHVVPSAVIVLLFPASISSALFVSSSSLTFFSSPTSCAKVGEGDGADPDDGVAVWDVASEALVVLAEIASEASREWYSDVPPVNGGRWFSPAEMRDWKEAAAIGL